MDTAGTLVTGEILSGKAESTRQALTDAGLNDIVEIRVGDARDTLADLPGPVDVLVLDGRNDLYISTLQLVEPRLAPRALVIADLGHNDPDLLDHRRHIREPGSGYHTITLPLDGGIELSNRTS